MPKITLISKYSGVPIHLNMKDRKDSDIVVNLMRGMINGTNPMDRITTDAPDLMGREQSIIIPKSVVLDCLIEYRPGDNTVPRTAPFASPDRDMTEAYYKK